MIWQDRAPEISPCWFLMSPPLNADHDCPKISKTMGQFPNHRTIGASIFAMLKHHKFPGWCFNIAYFFSSVCPRWDIWRAVQKAHFLWQEPSSRRAIKQAVKLPSCQATKPSSRQAVKLLSRWAVKPLCRQAVQRPSCWAVKQSNPQALEPSSRRAVELSSRQAVKPSSHQAV